MTRLKISTDGRRILNQDDCLFFYLGDTAWELFHRLNREEAVHYCEVRARQKFNVVQAVVLAEFDGLNTPNFYGHKPLIDNDPTKPNEPYFEHVDFVTKSANDRGLFMAMLPTWGDKVNQKWGKGPEVFTPENAYSFGLFLGKRYRDADLIWMLGGDRPIEKPIHAEIWRAMAKGLREGDDGNHLITYHPSGRASSVQFVHDEPWLDFNTTQTGHHGADQEKAWEMIPQGWAKQPTKPIMDAEPCYEDHPIMAVIDGKYGPTEKWFEDTHVRLAAYRSVFSGACGHTYGCHDLWQMYDPSRNPAENRARTPWKKALELPGANQMQFLRKLIEESPRMVPVDGGVKKEPPRLIAEDGSMMLIYCKAGEQTQVDSAPLKTDRVDVSWFNPRNGEWGKSKTDQLDWVMRVKKV